MSLRSIAVRLCLPLVPWRVQYRLPTPRVQPERSAAPLGHMTGLAFLNLGDPSFTFAKYPEPHFFHAKGLREQNVNPAEGVKIP